MTLLKEHQYRGNIRELRNLLSRAMILTNSHIIDRDIIQQCLDPNESQRRDQPHFDLKTLEENYLQQLLEIYQGDKAKVASIAGISVRSLYRKLQDDGQGHKR